MKLLKIFFLLLFFSLLNFGGAFIVNAQDNKAVISTKKERNRITKGNQLYDEGKYKDARKQYEDALKENPASVVGRYNLGLSELRIGSNPNDTSETAKNILASGVKNMEQVANMGKKRPDLASKANYNLGNVAFTSEDYQKAIDYYKRALRLNPEDNNARRNLRIAQLKLQNQDQDQNQDQNQDQQDQNQDQNEDQQDQQEQNQDQNQDQQDQNQDQNQDQQNQQDQQPQSNLNQQTAEQILNAIENKENQTRARVAGQNAEKSRLRNRNRRNW